MTERITAQQFHEAAGVEDWRALFSGACAHFRTGTFATGVALVDAIGRLADAANHHPDVDLRYAGVTVRLWTHDVNGLSERDVELAKQIGFISMPDATGATPGDSSAPRCSGSGPTATGEATGSSSKSTKATGRSPSCIRTPWGC